MPLWDVRIEEWREVTVTVEARTSAEARAAAMHPVRWLDRHDGPVVHIEPFEATQRGGYDEEPDALSEWKYRVENQE